MVVLMFSVGAGFSDEKLARLLSRKAEELADSLAGAVEDVICEEHGWDMTEVHCEMLKQVCQTLRKV